MACPRLIFAGPKIVPTAALCCIKQQVQIKIVCPTLLTDVMRCQYPGPGGCGCSGAHQFIQPFSGRLYILCADHYIHARRMAAAAIQRRQNTCVVQ